MFTNPSRELFTSETESETIVACVRKSSSVVILFESAIDRAGQVSENAAVRTRGVRGGPFHRFQSNRGLSVAANLDKENISTVSILTLVSTRTVSVFRLVRPALDWHAKEAKAQGWQQQQRATSRDGWTRVENRSLFSGTGRCRQDEKESWLR